MNQNTNFTDEEAQFLKDLETAKRLSIETFNVENTWGKGATQNAFDDSFQFTDIGRGGSAQHSQPPHPQPFSHKRPVGFILPQRSPSLFHESTSSQLPGPFASKNTEGQSVCRSQSTPNGTLHEPNPIGFLQTLNQNYNSPGNAFASTSSSIPGRTGIRPSSGSSVRIYSKSETNKFPTSFDGDSQKASSARDLYGTLSDHLKSFTDDLIDLGQNDDRNLLQDFDPLFSTLTVKEREEDKPKSVDKPEKMPEVVNSLYENVSVVSKPRQTESRDPSDAPSNGDHGWKSGVSLYPILPTPTNNPYDTIDLSVEGRGDQSLLYDVYNQFEYLYAVSVSSGSSTYMHPYDSVPFPQGSVSASSVPLSCDKPSLQSPDYVSAQSVRLAKQAGRKFSSDKLKRNGKLYENITSLKKIAQIDGELLAFVEMLQKLKLFYRILPSKNPPSYIQSPCGPSECWKEGLSLKLIIYNEILTKEPATFTSDVTALLELVIAETLVRMALDGKGEDFILRVRGRDEYLHSSRTLINHRYVQDCIKMDEDVRLVLVPRSSLLNIYWARPRVDETYETAILPEEIMPFCNSKVITFAEISKFLEVIDRESDKINDKLADGIKNTVNSTPLNQTVKGVCVLLGNIQTVELRRALEAFNLACDHWNKDVEKAQSQINRRTVIGSDVDSRHSFVEILGTESKTGTESTKDAVLRTKENVIDSVRTLVEMYSKSFPVSFKMSSPLESSQVDEAQGSKFMSDMLEPFLVRAGGIHRVKPEWVNSYADYYIIVEILHGTRVMGKQKSHLSTLSKIDDGWFFSSVIFDSWLTFEYLPFCILPRECRLVFSIFGRKLEENEGYKHVELGWSSIQCFDFQGYLVRGSQLLPLWPQGMPQKRLGPAPNSAFSYDGNVSLITIEFPDFGHPLKFPEIPFKTNVTRDFSSLDSNTQVLLMDIIEHATFTKFPPDEREVLWEKRHYLYQYPSALPKVLLSAQLWDFASLSELHVMLENWSPLSPTNALQLLLPCFPDTKVRQTAINWMSDMSDEDLISILPQLVEALSYETFDLSPLAEFLLRKALLRYEVTHALFWNLVSDVGLGKWLTEDTFSAPIQSNTPDGTFDPRRRRLELMLNSLLVISYHKWRSSLISQYKLILGLAEVTKQVKSVHPSQRNTMLTQQLKTMDMQLFGSSETYSLPISPAYNVTALDIDQCICYNSASVPLKINFKSSLPEGGLVPILYKQGDDIRQDMLTIQVIRMIESWWLKDGLDLRVMTFTCVPTGFQQGVVEIVTNAETLCKIQAEYGVTGAFRNRPIFEWLGKMNPSTLDYRRAVENFTRSCAAYCVLTYILGICDRHNDNIMLTNKGHLFHIDFGKFLGDSQMFGSFKRDRAPFVLTADMLYVINDGEKYSQRFHQFVELCCQAFKIVRQNGDTLMNLFAMMATAGIPGVGVNSVLYIQNALLPDCSNVEAAARFTRFIEDSLTNWFTPVNFFIHSLAQLRFSSDSSTENSTTLSFIPKVYSMDGEGRIYSAEITDFYKVYDPEKYYCFITKVKRKDHFQPFEVRRSYKQFLELYVKLCMNFPMAVRSLRALPKSSGIGRSNVKQVAEKRKAQLQAFLDSLFLLADEIAHSDLVYTFFHPLLQDEEFIETAGSAVTSVNEERRLRSNTEIHGEIKVCVQYSKGALLVLILHAHHLACPNGQPPSPYVKSYLQPDPTRLTKRKTRVVKRSQHPTFMEMIEYRLPLDMIVVKILQLSVWHHDPLQENNFLGGVSIPLASIPLEKETTLTYNLGNISATL